MTALRGRFASTEGRHTLAGEKGTNWQCFTPRAHLKNSNWREIEKGREEKKIRCRMGEGKKMRDYNGQRSLARLKHGKVSHVLKRGNVCREDCDERNMMYPNMWALAA